MVISHLIAAPAALGRHLVVACVAACVAAAALAQDAEFGPALDEPAPHDLALTDQTGAATDLSAILAAADQGAVVYFSRSLSWCPVCIAQAAAVQERLDAFEERGYAIAFVTTDTAAKLADYARDQSETGILLADPERAAIKAFGVLDPAFADKKPGSRAYALPYPSAFVINAEGVVVAKLFEAEAYGQAKGYRERITVDDVLTQLDALDSGA